MHKLKHILFISFTLALLLPSCKKENWLDWKAENQAWLANNAAKEGVITTPSGLQYKIVREGIPTNPHPDNLKTVAVSYSGSLITGNVFDSNAGTTLAVSELISGFAEGIKKMTPPAHYILYIPYNLGYGEEGHGAEGVIGYIPPYSTLVFDVYLHNVY